MQRFVATRIFRDAGPGPGASVRSAEVRHAVSGDMAYRRPEPIDVDAMSKQGGEPGCRV